jgi:hypothetical protein
MQIEIRDDITIDEVRTAFSVHYPFLKIEFYDDAHKPHEKSLPEHLISYSKTIGDVRKKHPLSAIEIHSWQKTRDVEQNFRKQFGLFVQIFRMQANRWVQIVGSDELTLEEQNEIGRSESEQYLNNTATTFELEKPL